MKRLSTIYRGAIDLFWSLEARISIGWVVAALLLVTALVGLKAIGWLAPALYAAPILIGAFIGLVFASLTLAFEDEGGDDLEDWFWIACWTVGGGLVGWGVSAFAAWGLS